MATEKPSFIMRSISDSYTIDDPITTIDLTIGLSDKDFLFQPVHDSHEAFSDSETHKIQHPDEFDDILRTNGPLNALRTGRHRRKLAARIKGGEFQASHRKRRLYFCCLGHQINIQSLYEELQTTDTWDLKLLPDVLRLFRPGLPEYSKKGVPAYTRTLSTYSPQHQHQVEDFNSSTSITPPIYTRHASTGDLFENIHDRNLSLKIPIATANNEIPKKIIEIVDILSKQSTMGAQEVYIFEFGAAVFWGFPKGEESALVQFIKSFVIKDEVLSGEFKEGEDDIGFLISPEATVVAIANDVITLPEHVVENQRLAVSYAIAQSTILARFESRVEKYVNEYKYIPETLASGGVVSLTNLEIGKMIGQVFVVRHDINIHTVVLDTPDFFWKEEKFIIEYRMTMRYLEMSERVESVNKRLDMLKDLLNVLRHQQEHAQATKLEW
eukprot:gene9964-20723_t